MKSKWMVVVCLAAMSGSAGAEEVIVIDAQTIAEQSPVSEAVDSAQGQADEPAQATPWAAPLPRERIIKGKMSARQKFAIAKAERGEENELEGREFLDANKLKPGVVTLPSGVQYKVIREGTGRKPLPSDLIMCRYRGTLLDGAAFEDRSDSRTYKSVYVSALVPEGLKDAVLKMPAGSKWEIFIPSKLGFGEMGESHMLVRVMPNATLIYEMELIGIK